LALWLDRTQIVLQNQPVRHQKHPCSDAGDHQQLVAGLATHADEFLQ
jgi:hypothetical protein